MPYINVKTNVSVTEEASEKVKAGLGRAICRIPGKSEAWLMCSVEGDADMRFQGNDSPAAMVSVEILGGSSRKDCESLCAEISSLLSDILGIDKSRIYVRFGFCDTWGYSGGLF